MLYPLSYRRVDGDDNGFAPHAMRTDELTFMGVSRKGERSLHLRFWRNPRFTAKISGSVGDAGC